MRSQTRKSVGRRFAADREPVHAELQPRRELGQRLVGALAAGEAVGEDADMMAAIDLAVGEVEDVAEDAADRRAHGVQDAKRLVGEGGMIKTSARRRMPNNVLEISRWD